MRYTRLLTALLFLLLVLAPQVSAQTEPAQPPPLAPAPAQPTLIQPAPDYRKLEYKIPLLGENGSDSVVALAFSHDSKTVAVSTKAASDSG